MCNPQSKSPEDLAREEPIIDSTPDDNFYEKDTPETGDKLQDIINS
jgi:hypothetical protein